MIIQLYTLESLLQAGFPLYELYVLVFGSAAIICLASLTRAKRIESRDTRNGLMALLATSGIWAALHVGYLASPTVNLQYGFYVAGLVVGLSTVGPWLYFCSAYTGRSLHRNVNYQRVAIAVYLIIVAIKVTNPLHGMYFTATVATTPFNHLMIEHQVIHWLAMGLAYSLAVVGIFMLFELFAQVDYDTTPFVVLVTLTGLPIIFDIVGFVSPLFIDITYSALGVAVFAVGVLFVYTDRFETIQLAGQYNTPIVVLDKEDNIRESNENAKRLFPELEGAAGEALSVAVPTLAACLATDEVLTVRQNGAIRYYRLSTNPFSASHTRLGTLLVLSDVTDQEQYRQELERQNERLAQFTGMVSHDLRNPLNIAQGNLSIAREEADNEWLEKTDNALARMEALIADLLALARQGKPIDETEPVSLRPTVERCWEMVDNEAAELVINDDLEFDADADRLQQLFENLFRNSVEHGGADVTITVGILDSETGFYVEDTGPGIPADKRDDIFESGFTTTRNGTGFGLAIVREIVEAHGWSVDITEGTTGGARFEVSNVTV